MERVITSMGMVAILALLVAIFLPPALAEWNRFNAVFTCLGKDCEVLVLDDQYLTGTDGACAAAGMLMVRMFDNDPDLKKIVIANRGPDLRKAALERPFSYDPVAPYRV